MNNRKRFKITDLFIGIVLTLLLISLAVIITINFRPLYYTDIDILKIVESSGLPKEEILENYNALIDYCSPFFQGQLEFPTLSASASGLQHFKEVKDIFTSFYILAAVTFFASLLVIIYKTRKKDISYLFVSSLTAVILPAVLGLIIMINFDKAFVLFHRLFFRNDLWLFDEATDPIITMLPDAFFLHCAILIILLVILGSLGLYSVYRILKNRSSIRYRKIKDLKV